MVWGEKYGRIKASKLFLNTPKCEYFKREINKNYTLLGCPQWFLAFSDILSLPCYRCYKTGGKHSPFASISGLSPKVISQKDASNGVLGQKNTTNASINISSNFIELF